MKYFLIDYFIVTGTVERHRQIMGLSLDYGRDEEKEKRVESGR